MIPSGPRYRRSTGKTLAVVLKKETVYFTNMQLTGKQRQMEGVWIQAPLRVLCVLTKIKP